MMAFHGATVAGLLVLLAPFWPSACAAPHSSCLDTDQGYTCNPDISHHLGQYSPFFAVPSTIPDELPQNCAVSFVNILSRHGARFPTASKGTSYASLISQIHKNVKTYTGSYKFLKNYQYTLGADILTTFGQEELVDSGAEFYARYKSLARKNTPFIRASGEDRVVQSAMNFSQGYDAAKTLDNGKKINSPYPYPILVVPESSTSNNTLNDDLCTALETGLASSTGSSAQAAWNAIWVPSIQQRLNRDLPGANLSLSQTIYMMDLCSFDTVAGTGNKLSPFCNLFTNNEFLQYDYYQSLGKYYGNGPGNAFGPTAGVGYTNELIARLTSRAVQDRTSTNSTLDSSQATFPLGLPLYADFSHDNDMTGIFAAMGLFNATQPLSNSSAQTAQQSAGYSAAWTVPYSGRAYFEKISCFDTKPNGKVKETDYIRVVLNGRVLKLVNCGVNNYGMCKLTRWIQSLSFAQGGGRWDQCFTAK